MPNLSINTPVGLVNCVVVLPADPLVPAIVPIAVVLLAKVVLLNTPPTYQLICPILLLGLSTFNVSTPTVKPFALLLINTGADGIALTDMYTLLLKPVPQVLRLELMLTHTLSLLFNPPSV